MDGNNIGTDGEICNYLCFEISGTTTILCDGIEIEEPMLEKERF